MGFSTPIVVLILCLAGVSIADDVPVYVWGDLEYKSQSANPLDRTSSAEFVNTLRSELTQKPTLIAFVEDTLSVEDLSRRDQSGRTLLPYLRGQLGNSLYLPSVQNPVEALNRMFEDDIDRITLTATGLSKPIDPAAPLTVIELSDALGDETRDEMVARHDAFMRETVSRLGEEGDVVAIYTARYPSWTESDDHELARLRRHLMQADETATGSQQQVYNVTNLLLAISAVTITSGTNTATLGIPAGGPTVTVNDNTMTVSMQDASYRVTLNIVSTADGYWALNAASVAPLPSGAEESYTISSVYALDGFSYHCGDVTFSAVNGSYTLSLKELQIEPFFKGGAQRFSDAFDCVGFFTVPIWSGIFVLTILVAIFFYGVTSMMDIRTMDRFDDPKGKTITISASE